MKKVLITGGTGLVGLHLSAVLINRGYEVVMFSRKPGTKNGIRLFEWNIPDQTADKNALTGVDHIIHLAGAGINDKRWTRSYKKELYDSRISSTRLLEHLLKETPNQVKSFTSASAVGIYGNHTGEATTELAPLPDTFLGKLCKAWEAGARNIAATGIRTTIIRTGIVLAKEAGFLPTLSKPVKLFAGAFLGSGKQHVSWVHIEDLCAAYVKTIEDTAMEGVYNVTAPEHVSNKDITLRIAARLHRPVLLPPLPKFILQLLLGDVTESLLADQRISSEKLMQAGFRFKYPGIDKALDNLL